jgi:hypothetical protein
MPDTATARRWADLLDLHDASGLTARAFGAKHGVNHRTLTWWRSRLKRAPAPPPPPATADNTPTAQAFLEVRVPRPTLLVSLGRGDAHITVDLDTDLGLLRKVLAAVC